MQQQANPQGEALLGLVFGIVISFIFIAPMVALAVIINHFVLGLFNMQLGGGSISFDPVSVLIFMGIVALIALLTFNWGWWRVHKSAGHAISKSEHSSHTLKLYAAMTLTLSLVILIIQIPLLFGT